jgi:hypothetical protein
MITIMWAWISVIRFLFSNGLAKALECCLQLIVFRRRWLLRYWWVREGIALFNFVRVGHWLAGFFFQLRKRWLNNIVNQVTIFIWRWLLFKFKFNAAFST